MVQGHCVTARAGAFGVNGQLTTTVPFDLDFELRDSNGNVLDTSGNLGPNEEVSGSLVPGQTYIYRVIGYGSGPTPFTITSEQFIFGSGGGSGSSFSSPTTGVTALRVARFTVNPLTKTISMQLL